MLWAPWLVFWGDRGGPQRVGWEMPSQGAEEEGALLTGLSCLGRTRPPSRMSPRCPPRIRRRSRLKQVRPSRRAVGCIPWWGGQSPRTAEPPGNRWGQRVSGQTVAGGRWSVGRVCSQERVGHPFERQFCRGSGCFLGVCFGGCSPVQSWVTGTSTGTRSWDGPVSCSPVSPGEPVGKAEV